MCQSSAKNHAYAHAQKRAWHLPIKVELECSGIDSVMYDAHPVPKLKIDWAGAREDGCLDQYVSMVAGGQSPFLDRALDSVQQVDDEILYVANLLCDAASTCLPHVEKRKKE